MTKVYIVSTVIEGERNMEGIFSTYEKARALATDIADGWEAEEQEKDFWGDDEFNCLVIDEHEVL